jgi:flagellar protein FliS
MMEGYKNYKEVEIETASGLKLVVMLYAGAIKFLNIAKEAIYQKKLDVANNNIIKAQDIITELMISLNFEAGDIAHNLYSLYIYMNRRLLEANIEKNAEIINEVIKLLTILKEAWDELLKNQKEIKPEEKTSRVNVSG